MQDVSKKDFPCGDLKEEKGIQVFYLAFYVDRPLHEVYVDSHHEFYFMLIASSMRFISC